MVARPAKVLVRAGEAGSREREERREDSREGGRRKKGAMADSTEGRGAIVFPPPQPFPIQPGLL